MLFCDPIFFLFFGGYLVFHQLIPKNLMMLLVVAGSLFFYGYWNPIYIPLPLILVLVTFWAGLKMDGLIYPVARRRWLTFFLVLLFCPLIFYKYLNFIIANLNNTFPSFRIQSVRVALPLGISFITFTLAAYLIDVFRGKFRFEKSLLALLASVLFFPHLIAGPIVRPSQLLPQLKRWNPTITSKFKFGFLLFSIGLFKKLALADSISPLVNQAYADLNSSKSAWTSFFAFYGFTLQIFCDFSGYTDMALGLSWILGIRLPNNFKQPYCSKSLVDFWRRWHITLSFWLRDYLYIPLGGGRVSFLKQARNIMITMTLGGLWHGANWTFVIWGFLHGVGIIINHAFGKVFPKFRLPAILSWLITLHFVALGWVFFRAPNLTIVSELLKGFWLNSWSLENLPKDYLFASVILCFFAITHRFDRHALYRLFSHRISTVILGMTVALIIVTSIVISSGSPAEFIYFDF